MTKLTDKVMHKKKHAYGDAYYELLYVDYTSRLEECRSHLSFSKYAKEVLDTYKKRGVCPVGMRPPPSRSSIILHISELHRLSREKGTCVRDKCLFSCGHAVDWAIVHELRDKWGYDVDQMGDCVTCKTKEVQLEDQSIRDALIRQRLAATTHSVSVHWPEGNVEKVDVAKILNSEMCIPDVLLNDPGFVRFAASEPFYFRWLDYDAMNPHVGLPDTHTRASYNGAKHPSEFVFNKGNVLRAPADVPFGVCYWKVRNHKSNKNGHNFVVFGKLGLPCELVVALARKESEGMVEMKTCTRKGAAGGNHIPNQSRTFDSKSCSACTKDDRVFLSSRKTRTQLGANTNTGVLYLNHDTGRVQHYGQVSTDLFMTDLSTVAKRRMLETDSLERASSLQEMRSRIQSMAIVHRMGLQVPGNDVFRALQDAIMFVSSNVDVVEKWRKFDKHLSLWDAVLLEHDCSSGESRLHQPCRYHEDGNDGHWLETYVAMPKVCVNQHGAGYSREVVQDALPADVSLVHQGFAVRTQPGLELLHLNLSETHHAADGRRGRDNYTRVKWTS